MNNFLEDQNLSEILSQLNLTVENEIEKNEKYLILKCIDRQNKSVVLKYNYSGSDEACRRINNETVLTKNLVTTSPLRFLKYYAHGRNYLVTEFENGIIFSPNYNYDRKTIKNIADALVNFQLMPVNPRELGVRKREGLKRFYLKVMLKHLIHLWPYHISLYESIKCLWILMSSLPVIEKKHVICHADFRPTNLIYNPDEECVIFTDLEGFLTENHPLFDVLSFCTIDEIDIWEWGWQMQFMRYYLEKTREIFEFDRQSNEFKKAFRGLFVFFLAYRLNETKIAIENTTYFDGLGKWDFLLKRLKGLFSDRMFNSNSRLVAPSLQIRKNNLTRMLSKNIYLKNLNWLFGW